MLRAAAALSKNRFHIPSLDGLRTLSFSLVFAAHAGLDAIVPGGFGVTVFFFLSGFLITTLMRIEFDKTNNVSLRNFYLRRVFRILPPFYLVLVVATALAACDVVHAQLEAGAVLAQALHYANYRIVRHGYGGFAPGTGVYWSLAVEEHFYLLFPLFYLTLRRRAFSQRAQMWSVLGACLLIFAWRCVLVYGLHSSVDRTYVASDTRFDSILFGCALAVNGNPVLDAQQGSNALWKCVLLPLGVCGLLASFLIREPNFRETLRYSLQGASLLPIFVCAMRFPDWGFMRVLNYRPIAYVGVLSYSLYLIHQVVMFAMVPRLTASIGRVPCTLLSLLVSMGLAWLVHRFVERPFARLRARFSA